MRGSGTDCPPACQRCIGTCAPTPPPCGHRFPTPSHRRRATPRRAMLTPDRLENLMPFEGIRKAVAVGCPYQALCAIGPRHLAKLGLVEAPDEDALAHRGRSQHCSHLLSVRRHGKAVAPQGHPINPIAIRHRKREPQQLWRAVRGRSSPEHERHAHGEQRYGDESGGTARRPRGSARGRCHRCAVLLIVESNTDVANIANALPRIADETTLDDLRERGIDRSTARRN